jgi:ketosteroid isomerase-like protein
MRIARLATLLLMINMLAIDVFADADADDDVAQIEELYASWRDAVAAADIPSYLKGLHPDIRLMPPGAEVIAGADYYAQFLVPVFASADYRIEVISPPAVEVAGDFAVAEYTYVIHLNLKNPDQGVTEPGALTASQTSARYFDVLRKTDGGWRVWRHTWQALASD